MNAGRLRESVRFERLDTTSDGYGNPTSGTWAEVVTVRGRLSETTGRERMEGGALHAPMTATLWLRSSSVVRGITEADRAVINSVNWNVRGIRNPDRRNFWLEMTLERDAGI